MKELLKSKYGIEDARLTKMEGYDSTNYRVETGKSVFVLKKYGYSEEDLALLNAENKVLESLKGLENEEFPNAIPTLDGKPLLLDQGHIFRMLSYVEGSFLGDIEHTPTLLGSFGTFLGKIDKTIHTIFEPTIRARVTQWDLQYFKLNHKFLKFIPDPKDRNLVDYFFLQFDERVYPRKHSLRKGVIHNDANDWNVLTKDGKVSGIIDFGDMCHSWIINEIAVALTYVMMEKENPLEVASEVIKAYHEVFPLEEIEVEVLYYLVAARLCTSVCNSAYTKTLKPDSEYITVSERPAWNLLKKWIGINPIKAADILRNAVGLQPTIKKPIGQEIKQRNGQMGKTLSLSYEKPIQMNRSAFQYMYDEDGNTFLDAYNNIMLAGHCHPHVVRAGQRAMAKLNTNTRYVYEILQDYAERLLAKFPKNLDKILFVNSGSAATDLGLRMSFQHTKKKKILTLEHGYHGNTKLAVDVSHYKYAHSKGPGQMDFVLKTPMPKVYGSGHGNDGEAGNYFANLTSSTITENRDDIAAFIAEPIMGCGGQVPLAKGYLENIYPRIRAQGGICISDEVQVGFGRLGEFFWGFEMHNVVPDMVILGKPMGNGHPIGAVVTTAEIAASFDGGPEFFSSFGGNPVSCAIGNAVLQVIEDENLQEHAKQVGNYFMKELVKLQIKHPCILDIRGSGLFIGIEIIDPTGKPGTKLASEIKNHLRENHILIGTDGPHDNVLKTKPPLSFTTDDADIVCSTIDTFLDQRMSKTKEK